MNLRPLTVGSAVVLASCIVVGAASSGAFAAPEHHARQVASSAKKTSTAITDVQQAPQRVGALQWVEVRVTVDAPTVVRLLDPSGEAVDAKSGDPQKPIVFQVKPNGQDTARYAVDTGQSSTVRVVDLDFRELPLSAPLDLSSERRLEEIARAVAHGQFVHEMRYEALPGAEVTVVSNGRSEVVTASGDGVATVPVEFRAGDNQVRAKQVLGAKESLESDDHYTFGATDSGSGEGSGGGGGNGGGDEAGGDNGGDKPGGGNGGGEQVDPASLRLDQQQGAELTPKDGKVTLSGRASSGWITVRDLEHGSDTTTEVHDGHWSVDVPATTPGWQIASIALSTTEHGAPVTQTTLRYVVRDSGDEPGGGGEQPGDGNGETSPVELAVDQSGSLRLDSEGFVTYTGTAPGESVLVFVNGKRAGEYAVHDGHFAAKVYQAPGRYKLTFLAKTNPHASVWDKVATTEVTVER